MFARLKKKETAIEAAIVLAFAICMYFMLPYILPILGFESYVIISGSMEHPAGHQTFFEEFWEQRGILAENLPMRYGLYTNDLVISVPADRYALGDVAVIRKTGDSVVIIHRILALNATHVRDIGDFGISEENMRIVLLGVRNETIISYERNQTIPAGMDLSYEGPKYEVHSHYWMPIGALRGKAAFVLPMAGLLRNVLNKEGEVPRGK